jgi:formate hydrogenlyase subunit 3/multisubunit Na+/H+ antiporter MnhD subunit
MNLPWTVWGALASGVILIAWPARRCAAWGAWIAVAMAFTILGELTQLFGHSRDFDHFATAGSVLAALWLLGFCNRVAALGSPSFSDWGWLLLTFAGLAAISCGGDWLTLGLAWEIVRHATAAMEKPAFLTNSKPDFNTCGPSLGLWTAIVACLFVTGSLELDEIATVLKRSYAAVDPEVSLGRPGLIVVAAACLTVISLLAPCFPFAGGSTPEIGDAQVAGTCARQLAAMLLLTRCCRDVFLGLEAPLSWLLLVLTGMTLFIAIRTVAQPSRLDRLWIGCSYWQLAVALMWLLVVLIERISAPGGLPDSGGLGFAAAGAVGELGHTIVVLAGVTAAIRVLARQHASPAFLEDLQGVARDWPVWGALCLLPLASLIGVPVLFGGRSRFLLLVAMWSLPQLGPDDTLALHGGLMAMLAVSLVAWLLIAGSLLTVFRTLLWHHPLTTWHTRRDWWSWTVAFAATALLFAVWWPW